MPNCLRFIALLLLFSSFFSSSQAQENTLQWKYETTLRAHRGFLFLHRQGLEHLSEGAVNGIQLDFSLKTRGKQNWHEQYNYPDLGVSLIYVDFGNSRLGSGIGAYPFYRLNFISKPKFEWTLQMGGGLGYLTEKWSRETNYKNVMIGSNWNVCIVFQSEVSWHISNRLHLKTGASFIHFSNGSTQKPNLGVNAPTLSLGLEYAFRPISESHVEAKEWFLPKNEIVVTTAGFFKSEEALDGNYAAGSARLEFGHYTANEKNRFHGSVDIMHNGGLEREFKETTPRPIELWQFGVFAGYSVVFGRSEVIMGMGSYLYSSKTPEGNLYHRAGYRYRWNEKWMANITLKTHLFKADYFEFGVARQLWKN